MRDYQLLGLQFMLERHDAGVPIILGDEMGLGKTLQSLALLAHLHLERGLTAPSLVVCPLSVLSSWMNEARRWVPGLKMLQMHTGTVEERKRMVREDLLKGSYHVCVTTYEMVKNEVGMSRVGVCECVHGGVRRATFFPCRFLPPVVARIDQNNMHNPQTCRHYLVGRIHWSYLVLDEGHVIKNEAYVPSFWFSRFIHHPTRRSTKPNRPRHTPTKHQQNSTGLAQTLRRMHLGNVLLLTGTPLQNKYVPSSVRPTTVASIISSLTPKPLQSPPPQQPPRAVGAAQLPPPRRLRRGGRGDLLQVLQHRRREARGHGHARHGARAPQALHAPPAQGTDGRPRGRFMIIVSGDP